MYGRCPETFCCPIPGFRRSPVRCTPSCAPRSSRGRTTAGTTRTFIGTRCAHILESLVHSSHYLVPKLVFHGLTWSASLLYNFEFSKAIWIHLRYLKSIFFFYSDIHGGLNNWIEHRCPLSVYGCGFRYLHPSVPFLPRVLIRSIALGSADSSKGSADWSILVHGRGLLWSKTELSFSCPELCLFVSRADSSKFFYCEQCW